MTTRHAPTVLDLDEGEAVSLARLVRRVAHAVHDALSPVGLNIYQNNGVASGQTIPHYHVHVVPRYQGDRPELLLAENARLIPYEERAELARRIADRLPG
jgi:histidine triad (HIT) family protein